MKYIVLVPDGMADYPVEDLGGKTPLEAAKTPNLDFVVKEGLLGRVKTVPLGLPPASDVANLSIFGYDPQKYYTGRGPFEAANLGIALEPGDIAFRCNLITAEEDVLTDYSAGHISTKEAVALMRLINEKLGSENILFYPGMSYRHIMIAKGGVNKKLDKIRCVPPHDIIGEKVSKNLPCGENAEILIKLMQASREILSSHEVNNVRIDLKENPANMIWLWGQGVKPDMPKFSEKFGISGSVISAVDLIKGIGRIAGLEVIDVPGATGYYDTDYFGKAKYALKSLDTKDFVYVHIEAPDEAGHNGDLREKIAAIERFDQLVVGTILDVLKEKEDFRLLILPDHATPLSKRTHTPDDVGFVIYGSGIVSNGYSVFTEEEAKKSSLYITEGHKLMEYFIR
ncbi:MAG: cofactor-independent phosphoglycerate mutase [Candidatus Omnitrophota bacterium]|nr:cofactor-independent phosphoglycerate mutase [Candidatus Omnitrophota bacterium]